MAKKQEMDFGEDRYLKIAGEMLDEHNYIGALKMLNRNAELGSSDVNSHMLYAETYDDMELYEKCINSWFAYIDNSFSDDFTDAYEGLAVSYMNLGRTDVSAYYYDKLLRSTGGISEAERYELIKSFLGDEKNPLKIVYPPELADYSDVISSGVDMMRENKYGEAIEQFKKVAEGNSEYYNARNYIAMGHIINGNLDEAESECLAILDKDPKNVHAMISLAAVKSEQDKREESVECAKNLLALNAEDPEDIYKIATVCCENSMHKEAYEQFCRLDGDMQYDFNMLFFKAVAANNCGMQSKAAAIFETLLAIYPDAYTARFFYKKLREDMREGRQSELSYYYRLPQDDRLEMANYLIYFEALPATEAKKVAAQEKHRLRDCIKWCIDEADNRFDDATRRAAAMCAVKAEDDELVRQMLLNAFLEDDVKIMILQKLCERNQDNNFGVVCCNLYRNIDLYAVDIGRTKRKIFVTAYSQLVCRFSLMDTSFTEQLAQACEQLYYKLEGKQLLNSCTHTPTVAAAIFATSGIKTQAIDADDICTFFNAKKYLFELLTED